MNFQWNNIYVLQFLIVLNVNALKLVPADRTVIKKNGTTRTIERYFLLPNGGKNNPYSTDDVELSKLLSKFGTKSEVKKAQPGKKIVDRYKIYIKRKLKNGNKNETKIENATEIKTSTTEAIENSTVPVKVITHDMPLTEIVTDPHNEHIAKKKQLNLNTAFPELLFGKKHLQTLENKENLLGVKVHRAEYPEQLIIERTRNDLKYRQDPYEILKGTAVSQAQKQQSELQLNQNIDIPQLKGIISMSNGAEIKEDTIATIDQNGSPTKIKLNKLLEALSQAEVNELYAQLYGKYIHEKSNNSEPEINIQSIKLNVDGTAKQIPEYLKNETTIKLLSVLHDTPEKYTEQAITNTILNHYNPSEKKEFAGKSVDSDKQLVYQTRRPPLLIENYNIKTQNPVKSKEIQQLTITGAKYSNQINPRNPLKSYFIKYGIPNHGQLFNDQLTTVRNSTTSSSSPSFTSQDELPTTKFSLPTENPNLGQFNVEYTESKQNSSVEGIDQEVAKHSANHSLSGYKDNIHISNAINNPTLIRHASIENTEPSVLEFNQESIKVTPEFAGGIDISTVNKSIGLGFNQENLEHSKVMKIPDSQGGLMYSQTVIKPGSLRYNPGSMEYSANIISPSAVDYQAIIEPQPSKTTFQASYSSGNTDKSNALKSLQHGATQVQNKYSQSNLLTPVLNLNVPAGNYSKTSRNPNTSNSMNINLSHAYDDDAVYKFSTEYIVPSAENSGFTTISENTTTDENKLGGGMGDEWKTVYHETGVDDEQQSKQPNIEIDTPNIEIGTNLVQIEAGDEVSNYHAPNTFDLASMCPECVQEIRTKLIRKLQTTGTDEVDGSVTEDIQLSSLYSQLLAHKQAGDGSKSISLPYPSALIFGLSSLPGSINPQGLLELIQNLNTQKQQMHLNPEDDQSLVKILEIVKQLKDSELKDSVGDSSTNLKEAGTAIFSIQNLRKVLEALEIRKHIQPIIDRETANLYVIIKIIFDTAMKQTQIAIANGQENSGAFWFRQLSAYRSHPLMNYVYNLIRQKWLQEIMFQLYYNNYNMNVVKNPRWVGYLRAWHLPINLVKYVNTNEYYDQNEYVNDDYIQKVYSQNDAGVILNHLRNSLIGMQYYEPDNVEYRKQTKVFSPIVGYMRQRDYYIHVIQKLIRKFYALLNANKTFVVVLKPLCLNRQ